MIETRKKHDLHDFMMQISNQMQSEYDRIQKSAKEDPGTAGDEGEENWAQILRDWLPSKYEVVTKGQILSAEGKLSPQVDVIVLSPNYPPALRNKKKYLAGGVVAAFECKLTLKKRDIYKTLKNATLIKNLSLPGSGTPYKELMSKPIYGLLAHTSTWKSNPVESIDGELNKADSEIVTHPREMLDLICVSDTATWAASKQPLMHPDEESDEYSKLLMNPNGIPTTSYMCHSGGSWDVKSHQPYFTPIGIFLAEFLVKLAWKDSDLRDIARYFIGVEFSNSSQGTLRYWDWSIYSSEFQNKLSFDKLKNEITWDEWCHFIE